jgi:hypothetical protein
MQDHVKLLTVLPVSAGSRTVTRGAITLRLNGAPPVWPVLENRIG